MTPQQTRAYDAPLIGRHGDAVRAWPEPPWSVALSFNR
jgi:hypothetical protein